MAYSGLITHFLGQGTAAARPADPGITPDGISFWWSTDTNEMSAWVEGAWNENVLTALKPTNNLSDLNNIITSRINLGATTIGANLFTLGNPGAIRFIRINADNSISALAAAAFRTAIGAGSGDMLAANNLSDVASAATSRTNLGATTIGANLFTLANPGAITFPRYNADNSVSALDAASFRAAIGAGSGGGSTPAVRASNIQSSSAASYTVTWPTGTIAGDAVLIFCGHGIQLNNPAGWSVLDNSAGTNFNGAVFAKVMTAGDITAGSVAITTSSAFNGVISAVTLNGATFSLARTPSVVRSSTGVTSVVLTSPSEQYPDLVLVFIATRGAVNCTFSTGITSQQAINAANASGALGEFNGSLSPFPMFESGTFSAAGTGYYTAVVAVKGP